MYLAQLCFSIRALATERNDTFNFGSSRNNLNAKLKRNNKKGILWGKQDILVQFSNYKFVIFGYHFGNRCVKSQLPFLLTV